MFDNTKIAFQRKSNQELLNARWLFYLMQFPALTLLGKFFILVALKMNLPIKWLLKKTLFQQFVGGENSTECLLQVDDLFLNYKVGAILDYAVEGKDSEFAFEEASNNIINTIRIASTKEAIPFAVFKLSAIISGDYLEKIQKIDPNKYLKEKQFLSFQTRLNMITETAIELHVPLLIDAEESWIQEIIDEIVIGLMQKYNRNSVQIFNTLQCYRKNAAKKLEKWHEDAIKQNYQLGVKLVRGAYMEKEKERAKTDEYPSPICESKTDTDFQFDQCVSYCLKNLSRINVIVASHNETSFQKMIYQMKNYRISPSDPRVFSAQLYGMSDHITFNLIDKKLNVVKYIPYGPIKEVLPYLFRRANENKSVQGQSSRELNLIEDEINRRKN